MRENKSVSNHIIFGKKEKPVPSEEVSIRNKRSRARGRYGESRLAKKNNAVVVGRSKAVRLPSGKWQSIDIQHPPDCVSDLFAFESKYLKKVPMCLVNVMTQAVKNCSEGLIPVGVLADRESRTVYYCLMEKDWLDLHCGNVKEEK